MLFSKKLRSILRTKRSKDSSTFGVLSVIGLGFLLVWLSYAYPKKSNGARVNPSNIDDSRARPSLEGIRKLLGNVVNQLERPDSGQDKLEKSDRKELDQLLRKVAP